jgi:3-hydroxybutyryl-CoA dehydrogenase
VPESETHNTSRTTWLVGVVGLGTMGSGIAQVAAAAGFSVVGVETSRERAGAGHRRIAAFLERGMARGQGTPEERDRILSAITTTDRLTDLRRADIVIEAIYEDLAAKQALFRELDAVLPREALLATNTSGLTVHAIAGPLLRVRRIVGLHFFNPAPLMPLVEVVRPAGADPETVAEAVAFCRALGKEPVVVKDRPGFLVNRLLIPYLNQAADAYDHGLASREDLDTAVELGLGYPMGPLKLLDRIGLDVHLAATEAIYAQTYRPEFRPPAILRELVARGSTGKKNGSGFYAYDGPPAGEA